MLALAIGFGAHTSSLLLDASLLRPLPYKDADRLLALWQKYSGIGMDKGPVSYPQFLDWRTRNRSFEELAAYIPSIGRNVSGGGAPERIVSAQVSANLFPALGVSPILGRRFQAEDEGSGANRAVIVGHELWQRRLGSDPGVVGKSLLLDGESYTIVGVMPGEFYFPSRRVELWTPLAANTNRGNSYLAVLARLKPGVSMEQSRADISAIGRQLQQEYPMYRRPAAWGFDVAATTLDDELRRGIRRPLEILGIFARIMLLIGCINAANLMMAQALKRTALQTGRRPLLPPMAGEALCIAGLGVVGGMLLCYFLKYFLPELPATLRIAGANVSGLDLVRVSGITLIVAVPVAAAIGLTPALQARIMSRLQGRFRRTGPLFVLSTWWSVCLRWSFNWPRRRFCSMAPVCSTRAAPN